VQAEYRRKQGNSYHGRRRGSTVQAGHSTQDREGLLVKKRGPDIGGRGVKSKKYAPTSFVPKEGGRVNGYLIRGGRVASGRLMSCLPLAFYSSSSITANQGVLEL